MNNLNSIDAAALVIDEIKKKDNLEQNTLNVLHNFEATCKGLAYHWPREFIGPEQELSDRIEVLIDNSTLSSMHDIVIEALSNHRLGFYLVKNEKDIIWNPLECDFSEFEKKSVSLYVEIKSECLTSNDELLKMWECSYG
ncbi:hypothetical protein [Aliivibrio fischeri]|uniref:hypothetical protein n=1 Tax=Aliivibrio fischeri TaxID=668 RepID=UPI0007C4EC6C|nr:hypothetical protein [Aliivibrio fischeri]